MSTERVKWFFEKLIEDEKLQGQINRLSGVGHEDYVQQMIYVAATHGYEFTKVQLKAFEEKLLASFVENGELSKGELEAVARSEWGIYEETEKIKIISMMVQIEVHRESSRMLEKHIKYIKELQQSS